MAGDAVCDWGWCDVAVDGLNQLTITAGSEGVLRFWNFKNKVLIHSMSLDSSPNLMLLHRDR